MQLEGENILIISNEPWGNVWYSKHNWANALSVKNRVIFINPPKKWNFKNLFKTEIKLEEQQSNLFSLTYQNKIPFTRFNLLFHLNEKLISKKLKQFLNENNFREPVFWSFDPYRLINPKLVTANHSIYFIVDKYIINKEYKLIENSDHILSISEDLIKVKNKKHLILSHGIGQSEFNANESSDLDVSNYALYIGNIDHRLDYEFLSKIVHLNPDVPFVFIGNLFKQEDEYFKDFFERKKYKNIIYHKAVHFSKLKNYIAESKICLAPMKLEVSGNNINHHKLLQYLALGKPVLSAQFSDYANNDILNNYSTHEDGINQFRQLIQENNEILASQERIEFAQKYTYNNLIKTIENNI